jgi:hypothetical protein
VLTDGEVSDPKVVLDIARRHANTNRCFTLGVGAEAFVGGSDDIADQLIPQLESAISPTLPNVTVDLGGLETAEFAPFPIPAISRGIATTVFANSAAGIGDLESVLVSGESVGVSIDFTVPVLETTLQESVIPALFDFTAIQGLERELRAGNRVPEIETALVRLSTTYGILCSQTAFVGVTERVYWLAPERDEEVEEMRVSHEMFHRERAGGVLYYAPPSPRHAGDGRGRGEMRGFAKAAPKNKASRGAFRGGGGTPIAQRDRVAAYAAPAPRCAVPPPPFEGDGIPLRAAEDRSSESKASRRSPAAAPPPPVAAAESASITRPSADPLMRIVELQNLDGSWTDTVEIVKLSGKDDAVFTSVISKYENVFATVLAIAILRR